MRDLLLRQSPNDENGLSEEGGKKRSSRGGSKQALRVREHPKEGVIVEGLSRHIVNDYDAVEDFLRKGNKVRLVFRLSTKRKQCHDISCSNQTPTPPNVLGVPNPSVYT